MEESQFLKTVMDEISKALIAGGYNNIEYFDKNIVSMDGISGQNVDGEETIARVLKPVGNDIIVTLAYKGNGKYIIIVTLDKDVDFVKFDKTVGDILKRLISKWGSKLDYRLDTWGRELKSKDDRTSIKKQIGSDEVETMDKALSEAKINMTGTTRSSYQRIGECKVIIRHSNRVNEEKFGARSRNIESIFIETKSGERFKVSENNLNGARAMARHLSNSGSPFDVVGTKITTIMEEMKQLRVMIKESRKIGYKRALSEEQENLTTQIKKRYINLRETLKKMSGKVGYSKFLPMLDEEQIVEYEMDPSKQWGKGTFSDEQIAKMDTVRKTEAYLDRMVKVRQENKMTSPQELFVDIVPKDFRQDFINTVAANADAYRNIEALKGIIPGTTRQRPEHKLPAHVALQEKSTLKVDTESAAKKKKEEKKALVDQTPEYDRPLKGKTKLSRNADTLFSTNESKYGITPEEIMLESWFNDASKVEFFKEEELIIEDSPPKIEKTLPENALGMLNMYMNHPLFNYYINLYEKQEILDDVLALVEEDSKLWNTVIDGRKNLKEYSDNNQEIDFKKALNNVHTLISDRRLSLENAIDQVTNEIVGDTQDEEIHKQIAQQLWKVAEESGLVKHDFGSTFSDQVLSSNDTVSAHNNEIDAEEYYGDAKFAEGLDMDTIDQESEWALLKPGYWIVLHDLKERGYGFDEIEKHAYEEFDNDMNPDDIKSMLNDFFDLHGIDVSDEYDDSMDGDHESALASAGWGTDEDYGSYGDDDMFEEMNRVRVNAGLVPLIKENKKSCSCGCDKCGSDCKCPTDCSCGCSNLAEGDPFARQSKRNLKNPKSRMSLINPEDKMSLKEINLEEMIYSDYDQAELEKNMNEKAIGGEWKVMPFEKNGRQMYNVVRIDNKTKKNDVDEAKAIPDWVRKREETMIDRLDRGNNTRKSGEPRGEIKHDDRYSDMAKTRGISDDNTNQVHKKVRGVRENENYVEVDMPHHLPKSEENFNEEPVISEDGARIIELARYRRK